MNRFRLIATFFVISIGLVGSYFIVKNSGSLPEPEVKPIVNNSNTGLSAQTNPNPIKWAERVASGSDFSQDRSEKNSNFNNATDFFAKSLFEKMKSSDQAGKNPFISPDASDLSNQKFINGVVADLSKDALSFDQKVNAGDLKISSDNSKENKIKYLQAVVAITKNRFNDSKYVRSADQIISDIENDCKSSGSSMNQDVANLYRNLVNDYLNFTAPSDYLVFHKNIINHFKKSEAVYNALANCASDPIKGYAAAQNLSQLITNAQQIQSLFSEKAKEIGFNYIQ